MTLTAPFLARGAVFAGEQAGRLFHEAAALFRNDSFSTCVGLCVFSQEEVGRAFMLLQQRKLVLDGKTVDANDLARRMKDHQTKLEFSMPYVPLIDLPKSKLPRRPLRELREDEVGRITQEDVDHWVKLMPHLEATQKAIAESTHKRRLDVFYLNVDTTQGVWLRPCSVTSDEARLHLHRAAISYADVFYAIRSPRDTELRDELAAWKDHPTLPDPIYVEG
jgi:AbiV family abortive infection protein